MQTNINTINVVERKLSLGFTDKGDLGEWRLSRKASVMKEVQ